MDSRKKANTIYGMGAGDDVYNLNPQGKKRGPSRSFHEERPTSLSQKKARFSAGMD